MAKDPAILFYTSDFLSGTYTMTNEQVGKYIRLLCLQHQKNRLSEKDMFNICGTYDVDIFSKFVCENGEYFNHRLEEESLKRKKYSESRSKNRNKKHMNDICKTYDQHMENENENENINEINIKNSKYFKAEDFTDLPEHYITSSIEQLKIQKNTTVTNLQVIGMWNIFKRVNLTGDKFYNSENEVYRHFTNWIKNQKFEKNAKSALSSVSNERFEQSLEYLNRYTKKDSAGRKD